MLKRWINWIAPPLAAPGIEGLYRACVLQARLPVFYAQGQVPDTVDGRFDLLILHVLLLIARLRDFPAQTQQLFDILFADMDKNLRQMGVSDMSISKKMKPLLAAFYGRARIYEAALAGDDAALATALQRNIYGAVAATPDNLQKLTAYVRACVAALAEQTPEDLVAGRVIFARWSGQ